MQAGLKSGQYVSGTLNISPHNYLSGSIYCQFDGRLHDISIVGRERLNRAIHGDVVVVQVDAKQDWTADEVDFLEADEGEATVDQPEQKKSAKTSGPLKPSGKVVGVLKRNWRPFCGTLDLGTHADTNNALQSVWFVPLDRKIPRIRIRTRQGAQLANQRIMVQIDAWPIESRFPVGHYVRTLGGVGERSTETEVLLLEHDVRFEAFSKQILADLPTQGESWIVQEDHLPGRMDLRHLDVCSIDPPGCTDIDDALHCRVLKEGELWEIGVRISFFSSSINQNDDCH